MLSTFSGRAAHELYPLKQLLLSVHIRFWWRPLLCLLKLFFSPPFLDAFAHPPSQTTILPCKQTLKYALCSETFLQRVLFCFIWRSVFMYPGSRLHMSSLWDLQALPSPTSHYTALLVASPHYSDSVFSSVGWTEAGRLPQALRLGLARASFLNILAHSPGEAMTSAQTPPFPTE